jgi:hypothetical protein
LRHRKHLIVKGMIWVLCLSTAGAASAASRERPSDDAELKRYLGPAPKFNPPAGISRDDTYQVGWVDLNGDGRLDALIRDNGPAFCGSGGCGLRVLERTLTGFRSRGWMTITQLPVEVLNTRHHGWRDISVFVAGGGIRPGYQASLAYDGRRYPGNPTVSPARPLRAGELGEVLIDHSTPTLKLD